MTQVNCLDWSCKYCVHERCGRDKIELNPDGVCCSGESK